MTPLNGRFETLGQFLALGSCGPIADIKQDLGCATLFPALSLLR